MYYNTVIINIIVYIVVIIVVVAIVIELSNNNYEMIFVITCNGRHHEHVYGWNTVRLIGIRTSLYNMLAPNRRIQSLKDITYVSWTLTVTILPDILQTPDST